VLAPSAAFARPTSPPTLSAANRGVDRCKGRKDEYGDQSSHVAPSTPASFGGPKPAAWIKGYGDYEQRDGQASFCFAGTNFTANFGCRLSIRFAEVLVLPPSRPVVEPHYLRLCSPSWMVKA
jgi:hypothetical protein